MLSKVFGFATITMVSFVGNATAQTHLFYGDTTSPFIDLATEDTVGNSLGDSGVIMGFGERFDLPPGKHLLDSVDFIVGSNGDYSIVIEIAPAMTFNSSNGPVLLPDFNDPNAKGLNTLSSKATVPSARTSVSCGKSNVGNSFFIVLVGDPGSTQKYRASKQIANVHLDTVRGALVAIDSKKGLLFTELIDGNLVPSGVNVDMDIGITYEDAAGVQAHLSPSPVSVAVWPNPAPVGYPISVSGIGPFTSAEIIDDVGRVVRTLHGDSNASTTQLPTQGLLAGIYNAMLHHADGATSSVKFMLK